MVVLVANQSTKWLFAQWSESQEGLAEAKTKTLFGWQWPCSPRETDLSVVKNHISHLTVQRHCLKIAKNVLFCYAKWGCFCVWIKMCERNMHVISQQGFEVDRKLILRGGELEAGGS